MKTENIYHTRPCLALMLAVFQGMKTDAALQFAGCRSHQAKPGRPKKKGKK